MRTVIVIIVLLALNSCFDRKAGEDDLQIDVAEIMVDTSRIKAVLPLVNIKGEENFFADFSGKLWKLMISNKSSDVIFLYARGNYTSPFDSLLTPSIIIDSVFVENNSVLLTKPWEIKENFSILTDSIQPNSKVERILYIELPATKLFGKIFYGKKNDAGSFICRRTQNSAVLK